MKPKFPVLPVFSVAFLCAAAGAPFGAPQDQPPQFRTGIDLTQLQVTVLHKDTRRPLTGLRAEDFAIEVGGAAQRIATLAEVSVPGTSDMTAAGFAEAAHDVARNEDARPRLFVIVMNDAAGGNDPYDRSTGKQIAHGIVDGLGPGDRAAVVFVRDNRHAQDFTADRVLLRRAVDRFNPMRTIGVNGFAVLQRAQEFLLSMGGYRRALIFISPVTHTYQDSRGAGAFSESEFSTDIARDIRALASGAGISHVPVYVFSTHGLHAPTAEDTRAGGGAPSARYDLYLDTLRTIANLTGGRTIAAHNAPADVVPAVFDELRSYYVLGYEATHPPDGRRRWLQVRVKHPDALVVPSRVLIASTPPPAEGGSGTVTERDLGLMEAIGGPLPAGDLPLRLSSVPLAVRGAREHPVALTLALPPVERGAAEAFRIRLLLFDGEGRRELVSRLHDVTIDGDDRTAAGWNEVALRLDLRPGRYQLRLAVERRHTRIAGSVHATIIVPDFDGEALSLSGVVIGQASGRPLAGREALADVLPFELTAARDWQRGDRVGALLRIHQSPRRPARPVVVDTQIINARGAVIHETRRTIEPAAFADGATAEHRFDLPLSGLTPGHYLLRFVAVAGDARVKRDVRFSYDVGAGDGERP